MARETQPGILPPSMMSEIKTITLKLATSAFGKMCCTLTRDEFIEAFIQPDHVERLTDVYKLIGGQRADSVNVLLWSEQQDNKQDQMVAQLRYYQQPEMLVPGYVKSDFRYWTPAGKKIAEWSHDRKQQGYMVADAIDAMDWLNENAGSAMAFSLMFPALTPIMSRAATDGSVPTPHGVDPSEHWIVRKGQQIDALKTLSKPLPSLPREVIERIRDVSSFLLALMMTKDALFTVPSDTCAMLVGVPADALSHASLHIYSRNHIILGDTFSVRSFI